MEPVESCGAFVHSKDIDHCESLGPQMTSCIHAVSVGGFLCFARAPTLNLFNAVLDPCLHQFTCCVLGSCRGGDSLHPCFRFVYESLSMLLGCGPMIAVILFGAERGAGSI